jgi:hypothetical protein
MMHEHDFELIATIAEGEMRPAEQAAAEAALASCEDCRSDLELQREALTILRAAPPVTMTDMERATIHRNVSAAVTPAVKTSVLKPTVPWFQRLMPAMAAAAAALVVVGVGSILITGGGDSDAAAETTTVAAEDIRPATVEESAESTGGVQFDDMADATTTTMGLLAPAMSIVEDFGEVSRDGLKDLALELSSPQEADEGGAHNLERMSLETALVCSDIAGEEGMIEAVGRAAVDGEDAEIYRNQELVNVYATVDCSLIDSFE